MNNSLQQTEFVGLRPDHGTDIGRGLFILSYEIVQGSAISGKSRRFIDRITPDRADFFLLCDDEVAYSADSHPLPVELIREIIKNDSRGIFCRTVSGDRLNGEGDRTLVAACLGGDFDQRELIAGLSCTRGFPRREIDETETYRFISTLRKFYGEFISSRTVSNLLKDNSRYRYVLNRKDRSLIVALRPTDVSANQTVVQTGDRMAEEIIARLMNTTDDDAASASSTPDNRIDNLNISGFSLAGHDYVLISFGLRQTRTPDDYTVDHLLGAFTHKTGKDFQVIRAAVGRLSLLDDETSKGHADLLETIEKTLDGLDIAVTRLHRFAYCTKRQEAEFNLNDCIAKTVTRHNQVRSDGPRARFRPLDMPAVINGDADNVQLAMRELLDNAVMFGSANTDIEMALTQDGDGIVLTMQNDMATADDRQSWPVLLEPFVTTRPDRSGLGLPLARKVFAAHGGVLSIHTAPGARFVVRVDFPLTIFRRTS
ncbi:MAG: HAMP domain-containing histidine kinase [candidate division Zixibacteria bacterium]|nr:HAMP domain-containing histidine kinase [candidate division Zixibacteria bacterium]